MLVISPLRCNIACWQPIADIATQLSSFSLANAARSTDVICLSLLIRESPSFAATSFRRSWMRSEAGTPLAV